jgi:AGCS family alanine or glycine:cation symporter
MDFLNRLEHWFATYVVESIEAVIFVDVAFWDPDITIPLVVLWLIVGATFFTFRFQFVNFRAFRHAIDCTRGRYTDPNAKGEISHFQALSAALSATVGLGNIAGVAFAVGIGGPGAIFWMITAGFLGMSSKFAECALGQLYRVTRADGHVSGGAMHYLRDGLAELGFARLGKVLAAIFAVMCIGSSLGGGNMYQANQSFAQVAIVLPFMAGKGGAAIFGLVLAMLVGVVIIGGIKRIGEVAAGLVPFMCVLYIICGACLLIAHASSLGSAFGTIVSEAFSWQAGAGGFFGALIQGFRRAAFSNEAGTGSASIAHSAATTDEPIREGLVALLEPFIDTIIVCTMTGLVIVVTGAYLEPDVGSGIAMTSLAFSTVFPWFPPLLSLIAVIFAFSTMFTWSFYGENCWVRFLGTSTILV